MDGPKCFVKITNFFVKSSKLDNFLCYYFCCRVFVPSVVIVY